MRQAADVAAAFIRDASPRRSAIDWRNKAVADFVTEVDEGAEARIIEVLRAAEPGAAFIAEESYNVPGPKSQVPGLQFVVDPLDGTTNFLHGFPEYAVSIAALVDGRLAAGVVLNVPRNECYSACAGGGADLDGTALRVSSITEPARSLIGTGFPFKTPGDIPAYVAQLSRVMAQTAGVRRAGAASLDLASVAAGRFEAFWENMLSPWDVAAGILLVREAGGVSTDMQGRESEVTFGSIVAGNRSMHSWLLQALAG